MRRIKRIVLAAVVATMAFSMAGCNLIQKTPEAIQNTVLAKVGSENITLADVDSELQADIDYLKEQYPDEYANPLKAFEAVGQTADFPEMSRLLKQVEAYRGNGISAGLFYEGKVAEAISLIVEWGRLQQQRKEVRKKLSAQDVQQLENLTLYLNDHCIQDIPLEQIVRISCMSARKLQTAFKEYHGCTITEYIQQRRMSQAETLLAKTDLSIGQVAQSVGYTSASRFAELFRKSTGLLPLEYRRMSKREKK